MRDIAEHLDVSVSTVSRALNGHHYVDEATRVLVREAAEKLGYPLHNLRRPAKDKKKQSVLVLTRRGELKSSQVRGLPGVEEALAPQLGGLLAAARR